MTEIEFKERALENPVNRELLRRLPLLALNECHLTAGCLFQAIWNQQSARAAGWGVKDYDVFYFDDHDLSWEAEDQVIRRVADATGDLGVTVETRNQARVHLWYEERFGSSYPQLKSARDGIDRYLVACTCIGIDVQNGEVYAPDGLNDLVAGRLRINRRNAKPELFRLKAESYRQRWPWLTVVD